MNANAVHTTRVKTPSEGFQRIIKEKIAPATPSRPIHARSGQITGRSKVRPMMAMLRNKSQNPTK